MDRKRLAAWSAMIVVLGVVALATRGAIFRSPPMLAAIAAVVGLIVYQQARPKPKTFLTPTTAGELPAVNLIHRVAKAHKGRITAAEVLAETTLQLDLVTHTLDELTLAGSCQLVVGQKGTQVYYFPEFEDDGAKDELVT